MKLAEKQQHLLRMLPGIDHILELAKNESLFKHIPKSVLTRSSRLVVKNLRADILQSKAAITEQQLADGSILEMVKHQVKKAMTPHLMRTINATGVVVHTNLGRSLLADDAVENLLTVARRYSNLEFDLATGKRGSRYSNVEDILCELSGAEAAMVVNNNAGAVLLCLETIAKGKKVIVSRGELIEIGGSFRIPDVMAKSGGILKEVGTTNRTHLKDYEKAIEQDTGLLLKVHTSNYSIVGFTASTPLADLVVLGEKYQIPVMKDLGSGTFIDFSTFGLAKEPTIQETVAVGPDVVTFSGDKLLGGPQAGIIVGKKDVVDAIKQNALTRALRIDKLTLAALESTLRHYRNQHEVLHAVPTLRMITRPLDDLNAEAKKLEKMLQDISDARLLSSRINVLSKVGGGALPLLNIPSKGVSVKIKGLTPNALEKHMRSNDPPIIGRIEEDTFVMDLRTIQNDELVLIKHAVEKVLNDDG